MDSEPGNSRRTNALEFRQSGHRDSREGHSVRKKQGGEQCTKHRGNFSIEVNGFSVQRHEKQSSR